MTKLNNSSPKTTPMTSDSEGKTIQVKIMSRVWTVPVQVIEYSCCGDILTEDGFCHTCWEHCK